MTPNTPSDPPVREIALPSGPLLYTREGEGFPVVAVHGVPGSTRDFRWFFPALNASYSCIRLVLPGFAGAPLRTMPYPRLMPRGRLINEALQALAIERCLLIGHSMGGAIACVAVALEPKRYVGLALLASLGLRPHQSFRAFSGATALSIAFRIPAVSGWLLPRLRRDCERMGFKGHDDQALIQMVHTVASFSFPQHAKNVRRLSVPTMVASADDDPLIEQSISQELYWQCPNGPRLAFPDGGHNIQKTRAVELGIALDAWLKQLLDGS